MKKEVHILMLEDSLTDAELLEHKIRKSGLNFIAKRVETREGFLKELDDFKPDLILSDNSLPSFDGLSALVITREKYPDVPFIFVSGTIGEERAVESMKEGATDYVLKTNLAKLVPAIRRALHEKEESFKRKQAEKSFAESEEKFRTIFNSTQDGILLADMETKRFFIGNSAICRMLGYTIEEITNLGVTDIHPKEDLPYVMDQFTRQQKGEITIARDIPVKRKDGTIFYTDVNSSPIFLKGKEYMVGNFRDITARKQQEEELKKLSSVVEQTADIVIITDKEGVIQYVNPACEKFLGYTKNEIIGQTPRILKSGKQNKEFYQKLWQTVLSGNNFRSELINRKKNGDLYYEEKTITPMKNQQGVITHFVSLGKDITERKKLEEQLFRSQKMEEIGKFAGYIAHDFNNIISVVIGYASMILEDLAPDSPLRKDIEEIRKAGERATGLTRQLLAFSRKQTLAKEVRNLNPIIADIEKMLHRLIGEDIKLTISLDTGLNQVNVDPGQIEQVIMNLVINARDAMPEGGEITLRTKNITLDEWTTKLSPESEAGSFICLSIQDTGTGMDKDILSHVFEPFFTTKANGKGTGLGLSVCYGIVKQHSGWINAYSEKGKGTIFNIYLPAVAPVTDPPNGRAGNKTIEKKSSPVKHKGNGERILVLEDESELRVFLCRTLTDNGYIVFSAETAKEAFDIFKKEKHNFDLIFTDVVLPDSSGLLIAEKLMALKPELKVICSSGYMNGKSQQSIIDEKGYKFLQKPYPTNVLLETIKEAMEK